METEGADALCRHLSAATLNLFIYVSIAIHRQDSAPEEEPKSADSANSDFLLRCSLLRQGPNLKILDSAESAISA